MKERLRNLWTSRPPRDRMAIAALALLVSIVLYLWLVQSATEARAQLRSSVTRLKAQALRLERDATELARVRAAPVPPAPRNDLREQVHEQAKAVGLANALLRIEARNPNQVQVVFGSVVFADWLAWVATLQSQRIRLDTTRIEALSTPGLVSVTATLIRASPL